MKYKQLGINVEKILRQMGTVVSISQGGIVVGKGSAVCIKNKQSVTGMMATSEIELVINTKVNLVVGQIVSVWNMTITSIEPIAPDGVNVIAYTIKGSL